MTEDLRIVFEEDGYPRELIDARDRERAVRSEALSPDTVVTVYRRGAVPVAAKAADVSELRWLFQENGQLARPEPAPAPASPWTDFKDPAPRSGFGSDLSPLGEEPEERTPTVLHEHRPYGGPERPRKKRRLSRRTIVVLSILFVLFVIWRAVPDSGATGEAGEPIRYVATGAANVRSGPTAEGTEVLDRLAAGEAVVARRHGASDGSDWLEIVEGPNRGGYAWAGNFKAAGEAAAEPR